ncbi:hypothetical protein [Rhodobaculum claviforme]|uniref:Uncharacterized protein n=1 Tax=Rhodobaculum claviforme TaxID=1549854 RepID=A0A934TIR6_9RHOB|nr:hypothetical protein [Rhodobaculum claviforme]MBK5926530.1 hypothetical protein [Rhodobaculum claviforme]
MPQLVRMYIRHCLIGFAIAGVFVAGLVGLNVANLQHLLLSSSGGLLGLFLLFFFNGLLFASVQFAIAVMNMAETPDRGGNAPQRVPMADAFGAQPVPIPVRVSDHR